MALLTMLLLILPQISLHARADQFTIDANYPGGNIIVEEIRNNTVRLRQDIRDTEGWWFYWNFRVKGAAGRTLRFQFTDKNPIGVRGPAFSTDKGKTWKWLAPKNLNGPSFEYLFTPDAQQVRFAFAIPYQQSHLQTFLNNHAGNPHLEVKSLCKTRKGRTVERIHLGKLNAEPKHRVLLTARHHACESIANYALEGIVEEALANTETGRWLRTNVEILAIPFMDKDGVEQGDQGKNRRPHDHNRDYAGKSIYKSTAALRKFTPHWSKGKLKIFIDLHCPYISGPHNEVIYMVGSSDKKIWAQQQTFGAILQAVQTGPLKYDKNDNLPFGRAWNTAKNYGNHKSSSRWAAELNGILLATTIEIPYANAAGKEVNPESARAFGKDLAKALAAYLTTLHKSE
ncbi:MAG: M14-type cytosolic carboxypeptidase [Planctomycetota bacterium]|jgi:hypothetical protein